MSGTTCNKNSSFHRFVYNNQSTKVQKFLSNHRTKVEKLFTPPTTPWRCRKKR
ncbi:MAG: DUF3718 domain-containing protein [Alistipes sp.]|nr:DUF3718 domain-containing protein [Alistipes sp.]